MMLLLHEKKPKKIYTNSSLLIINVNARTAGLVIWNNYRHLNIYKIQKRTMYSFIKNTSKKLINNHILINRNYAVTKVTDKPPLVEGDAKSFDNNPAVKTTKYIKNVPTTIYTRHPEISQSLCSFPGCNNKVCTEFCAKPLDEKPKSVGHVTHGSPEKAIPFFEKDLNNKDVNENIVVYKEPHNTTGDVNEKKTETLHQDKRSSILEKILKDKNKTNED